MPVSAGTLRLLMRAGLKGEALAEVVESIDRDTAKPKSSAAVRQARYRERKASQSDVTRDITQGVTSDVTPPARVEDIISNLELSGQNKVEETPAIAGGKKQPQKRQTRLDPAWSPGIADLDAAMRIGLTEPEIAVEAPHFRDHHLAKGSTMADWGAAWRTWCTKALGYRAQGPPRGRSSSQSRRPEPPGIFDALDKIIDLDSKR